MKEEQNAEMKGPEQVKNENKPCLKDLPTHIIRPDDPGYNHTKFEITFYDYQWPQGINLEKFAMEELEGVQRLLVYAPMITDANFHLSHPCHNGFTGT